MADNPGTAVVEDRALPEEEQLRADLYGLLARLLSAPPGAKELGALRALKGDDSALGRAVTALGKVAAVTSVEAAEREYNRLFIGVGRGELLPYGSYYLTGFLNEKPLAVLREHMAKLGIARVDNVHEPEDHIATLCEIMAGLITGAFGRPFSLEDQEAFFNTHLAQWAGHFFTDLEAAESSVLYAPVGRIGQEFMRIEVEAWRMDA
ncbi:chaperone TorD involved in molybdoenzyme TorA maturation [Meinhardsimonia xiamenensis]|jgi:TorA maturation chaperone TorD|uniref:Chaperone TorD involved in molybdoenzyme TorA maturation n=1 Tax=Meinhardsimonia xiamenensis TaxID=990712 RepID=A0A1G9F4I5_9RHOB|nr:molecular chaperone TorD family protein [Meinhardsimonia xiamenensis]PRX38000.1 TorA maturation chaperone TorD [Meinhardsimonia xiamenensis]SDK83268.1 chaperone TorD involved in molybdoenzyme TorA maturation [Meinhardsimonia xiamenensis]